MRATTTTHRTHSREFKLQVVREAAAGQKRPSQLAREFEITDSLLCKWRKEYERHGDAAWTAQARREPPTLGLEQQVAALERFCGQLAWENAELKKELRHVAASASAMPGSSSSTPTSRTSPCGGSAGSWRLAAAGITPRPRLRRHGRPRTPTCVTRLRRWYWSFPATATGG